MRQSGFTLIELIMVLMVVGILAVYISSGTTNVSMTAYSGAEELVRAIRYAQQEAMDNTGVAGIGIRIDNDGFVFLGVDSPVNTWQLLKSPAAQIVVDIPPASQGTIIFDGRGTPTCTGTMGTCATAADAKTITVNADDLAASLTLEPFTGMAHR